MFPLEHNSSFRPASYSLGSLDDETNHSRRSSLVKRISFTRIGANLTPLKSMNPNSKDPLLTPATARSPESMLLTADLSSPMAETIDTSEWSSETTRNLLARIKQLRQESSALSTEPVAEPVISVPSSSPVSSPKTSTSSSSPPSTLSPQSSRKSSWSGRRLESSMRRDSFTSLFSSPSSLSLSSRLPRFDLKKRFQKQPDSQPSPPLSPLLSRSSEKSRIRHIPLVGLGIDGVALPHEDEGNRLHTRQDSDTTLRPMKSTRSLAVQVLTRQGSDATLKPAKARRSAVQEPAKPANVAGATPVSDPPECSFKASVVQSRPATSRSQSADPGSSSIWTADIQKPPSPAELSVRSASGIMTPRSALRRFRSITPLRRGKSSTAIGSPQHPVSKDQKKSFNSSFDFSAEALSFTFTYSDVSAKLRRGKGNRDLQSPKAGKHVTEVSGEVEDDSEANRAVSHANVNTVSYESQLINLRVKLGLPVSKIFHTGPAHLSHPGHPYTWNHVNLRCLVCPQSSSPVVLPTTPSKGSQNASHNQNTTTARVHPMMRPSLARELNSTREAGTTMSPTAGTSTDATTTAPASSTFFAVHPAHRARLQPQLTSLTPTHDEPARITSPAFTTTSPTSSRTPLTCAFCPTTCCIYSSLLSQLSSPSPISPPSPEQLDLFRELIRLTASGTPIGSCGARDSFSTFVKCSDEDCGKLVCPGCASRCRLVGCGSVICKGCREERKEEGREGWICGWHGD